MGGRVPSRYGAIEGRHSPSGSGKGGLTDRTGGCTLGVLVQSARIPTLFVCRAVVLFPLVLALLLLLVLMMDVRVEAQPSIYRRRQLPLGKTFSSDTMLTVGKDRS